MNTAKVLPILALSTLAFAGCDRSQPDTTKTTTQTETKQVGTSSESTTKTTVATAEGENKSVISSYVGTVTIFLPGKSIEVMTGNKDLHAFALDGANDVVQLDPATAVGSKIELVEEKGMKGMHRITVTIAPPA